MKFKKALNNNVALAINTNGDEVVIFGTGISFGKKQGDVINSSHITKVFHSNEELYNLINTIPLNVIELAQKIVWEGQKALDVRLSETIYFALSDHLNFAIERHKDNVVLKSPLHWEIRHLYPVEYEIGIKSLNIIKEVMRLDLPSSEASFIALHFVNAQYELGEQSKIIQINRLISEIINILALNFGKEPDKSTIDYSRFITHLRYFVMRYQNKRPYVLKDNDFLYTALKEKYLETFECVKNIKSYLFESLNWDLSKDEIVCLMIHIERLRQE